jgi:hypothetical protein
MTHARIPDARGHGMAPRIKVVLGVLTILLAFTAALLLTFGLLGSRAPAASPGRPSRASAPGPGPSGSVSPPSPPAPARHHDPFGAMAAAEVTSRSGTALAAVYDIRTGQTWTLGRGRPQAEASIVKLDILETLLARRRASSNTLPAGELSLAQRMIEDSDNDAATSLWDAAGGPDGIRTFDAAAGLRRTSPSRCVDCPGFPWPGWGLTTTTPADQIALLRQLVTPGSLLGREQQRYVRQLMEQVTLSQRWGVSGGVPQQVTVALKNGWLPLNSASTDWQINSIGWISGRGRDYLMAVLTTGNPTEQYGIGTIDELSASVWRNMR